MRYSQGKMESFQMTSILQCIRMKDKGGIVWRNIEDKSKRNKDKLEEKQGELKKKTLASFL